jgi:hypothetical protein
MTAQDVRPGCDTAACVTGHKGRLQALLQQIRVVLRLIGVI